MGACICLLEKWMMDDSRASVVVYNCNSILSSTSSTSSTKEIYYENLGEFFQKDIFG